MYRGSLEWSRAILGRWLAKGKGARSRSPGGEEVGRGGGRQSRSSRREVREKRGDTRGISVSSQPGIASLVVDARCLRWIRRAIRQPPHHIELIQGERRSGPQGRGSGDGEHRAGAHTYFIASSSEAASGGSETRRVRHVDEEATSLVRVVSGRKRSAISSIPDGPNADGKPVMER